MPLNIDWQQILLHVFNLLILVGGLWWLLYRPVKSFIDKRASHYESIDRATDEKLKAASQMQEELNLKKSVADEELRQYRLATQNEIDGYALRCRKEADDKAAMILQKARTAAEEEKKNILRGIDQDVIDMTKVAADKIIYASPADALNCFLKETEAGADNEK